jgi:hypothetical protein
MIAHTPSHEIDTGGSERARFERRIDQFSQTVDGQRAQAALEDFELLHADHDRFVTSLKARLLATSLSWSEEEIAACDWILGTHRGLAQLAERLLQALAPGDERASRTAAFALHYRAEAMKSEIALGRAHAQDFSALHAIIKAAIASGHQRAAMEIRMENSARPCCIESLYFRALLLARCAGGNLNSKQIEILDAWIWIWMPVLKSAPDAAGAAMSVDLDGTTGLRRGTSTRTAGMLYLPLNPIGEAYRAILSQFHQGRIVPAQGLAAEFRIEEHLAVIDLLRRALRSWQEEKTAPRAPRSAATGLIEMHVGIAEILKKAFLPPPPLTVRVAVVTPAAAAAAALGHDEAFPIDDIYSATRRRLHLMDTSSTGLKLQGSSAGWGEVTVGDLVALRIPNEPLVLGRIARAIPSLTSGEIVIGVSRMPGACLPVKVARTSSAPSDPGFELLYVSGDDLSGRDDGYLVSEGVFADRTPLRVVARGDTFTLRFNRVRQRGRGWVLAGFEIISASHDDAAAA